MGQTRIHIYIALIAIGAVTSTALLDLSVPWWDSWRSVIGFLLLTALGLFSEASAIRLNVGRSTGNASITFIPLIACVAIFGPLAAVAFFLVTGITVEFALRKKGVVRGTFNVAQYMLATAMGGHAFIALGGVPLAGTVTDLGNGEPFIAQLLPLIAFGVVFLSLNHALVSLVIALAERVPFRSVLSRVVSTAGGSIASDIFIAPLGILVAFLYHEFWVGGLLISLLPLAFVRYAYISKQRAEDANKDLLQALVKAIEIRDPYTSGHSVRVQGLALRIGRLLGLTESKLETLKIAALLHDIGKIEVVYEQLLMKPGKLTDDEFRMMQSHVTRGVEILTSLSSFDSRIIGAVRHHHESWDRSGYPDGIGGDDIPLLARIIKVSDSIDAMLSDRPYRKAMTVQKLESILVEDTEKEYDPQIVEVVLREGLVEEHEEEMRLTRHAHKAGASESPEIRLDSTMVGRARRRHAEGAAGDVRERG